jgi:hypothetical protein
VDRPFQVGDTIRVSRIPPHISADYPYPEVRRAFEFALGQTFRVVDIDWGGWVWLDLDEQHGGIGVQPDCVELIEASGSPSGLTPPLPDV